MTNRELIEQQLNVCDQLDLMLQKMTDVLKNWENDLLSIQDSGNDAENDDDAEPGLDESQEFIDDDLLTITYDKKENYTGISYDDSIFELSTSEKLEILHDIASTLGVREQIQFKQSSFLADY